MHSFLRPRLELILPNAVAMMDVGGAIFEQRVSFLQQSIHEHGFSTRGRTHHKNATWRTKIKRMAFHWNKYIVNFFYYTRLFLYIQIDLSKITLLIGIHAQRLDIHFIDDQTFQFVAHSMIVGHVISGFEQI